jgi:hypothetical protein
MSTGVTEPRIHPGAGFVHAAVGPPSLLGSPAARGAAAPALPAIRSAAAARSKAAGSSIVGGRPWLARVRVTLWRSCSRGDIGHRLGQQEGGQVVTLRQGQRRGASSDVFGERIGAQRAAQLRQSGIMRATGSFDAGDSASRDAAGEGFRSQRGQPPLDLPR